MMIDDRREVQELIAGLNRHLPMSACTTPALVEALRRSRIEIHVNDSVLIDSVLYLGDEGGIACAIRTGEGVVVASLTHLSVDVDHPLSDRILAYQKRRSRRLGGLTTESFQVTPGRRTSKRRRTGSGTRRESASSNPASNADPVPPVATAPDDVPRRFPKSELLSLPLRRETWQVGLLPRPSDEEGDDPTLWLFGVANPTGQEIRVATVIDRGLSEVGAWNELISAFLEPLEGAPVRPGALVVCRRDFHLAWRPLLSQIGVRCRYQRDPQPVGGLLEGMSEVMRKQKPPPCGDVDIREFPQSDAVWQAGFLKSPAWVVEEGKEPYRPWTVLVLEKSRSRALTTMHAPGDPAPEMLLEILVRTMARPAGEDSQRPRMIEVSDSDCYDHLQPRLEMAGIGCRLVDELREFDDFCLCLARKFDGADKCALADGPGVTSVQMESFYEAAEYYFKAAPWRRVPGEIPIQVCCDDPDMDERFAIVLGRTGVQMGLCVYDDWEITEAILCGYAGPEDNRALAVCYDDAQVMSAIDLYLIERRGWPIAAPNAWPAVMRLEPDTMPRSASADEVVFLDACLRAIPGFVKSGANSQLRTVETGSRPVELHLAWMTEPGM